VALAFAEIAGCKTKEQEVSIQTKEPGFVSYLFSSEGESTNSKELV